MCMMDKEIKTCLIGLTIAGCPARPGHWYNNISKTILYTKNMKADGKFDCGGLVGQWPYSPISLKYNISLK